MSPEAAQAPELLDPPVPTFHLGGADLRSALDIAPPRSVLALGQADGDPAPTPSGDGWSGSGSGGSGAGDEERDPLSAALAVAGIDPAVVTTARSSSAGAGGVSVFPVVGTPSDAPVEALALYGIGDPAASLAPVPGGRSDLAAGAGLGRALRGRESAVVLVDRRLADFERFVEGIVLGGYTAPRWAGPVPAAHARQARVAQVAQVTLVSEASPARVIAPGSRREEQLVRRAVARARATLIARNLAFAPSNLKNPAWMVDQARRLADTAGLGMAVWDEEDLRRGGFGGLLAVGGGSASPPRLVQLTYDGVQHDSAATDGAADSGIAHVVLVGKGITFDSGGLNIKPGEGMLTMKSDMAGAAVVLAVLAACRELAVRVRVTGLLALAENAVSGGSYRPGDVVTHYGGRTLEIGNTDAEGRVVMADALAYADAVLQPDVLIDVATLTGAATVALGRTLAPVFATDDRLGEALVAAGRRTGEPLWRFPLVEDYRPLIDSEVADLSQIAGAAHGGGSIMAALMLREFTGGRPWAHCDIAGPGRADTDGGHVVKGPTGFGARVLLSYLEELP